MCVFSVLAKVVGGSKQIPVAVLLSIYHGEILMSQGSIEASIHLEPKRHILKSPTLNYPRNTYALIYSQIKCMYFYIKYNKNCIQLSVSSIYELALGTQSRLYAIQPVRPLLRK